MDVKWKVVGSIGNYNASITKVVLFCCPLYGVAIHSIFLFCLKPFDFNTIFKPKNLKDQILQIECIIIIGNLIFLSWPIEPSNRKATSWWYLGTSCRVIYFTITYLLLVSHTKYASWYEDDEFPKRYYNFPLSCISWENKNASITVGSIYSTSSINPP